MNWNFYVIARAKNVGVELRSILKSVLPKIPVVFHHQKSELENIIYKIPGHSTDVLADVYKVENTEDGPMVIPHFVPKYIKK